MKICSRCRELKHLDDFYADRTRPDGKRPSCISCISESGKAKSPEARQHHRRVQQTWRENNRQSARKHHLKAKYGLSEAEYAALKISQGGNCAVCLQLCKTGHNLAVDHCHLTSTVRGLLCRDCNTGLGILQDSPILLRRAAEYLEKHKLK